MNTTKNLLILFSLAITACGTGPVGPQGPQGPINPGPAVSSQQADVNLIVQEENDYRDGLGQTLLSSGLSCSLSTFTSGDRIQASIVGHNTLTGLLQIATYLYKGLFNQPDSPSSNGNNVLPSALRSLYTNMYLVRCQGQIVVTESDYYSFELSSDDASLLYLDTVKLIDNDNGHGVTTVSGVKYLRRGIHAFRLDYAQTGGGNQALMLKSGGEFINPMYWFH